MSPFYHTTPLLGPTSGAPCGISLLYQIQEFVQIQETVDQQFPMAAITTGLPTKPQSLLPTVTKRSIATKTKQTVRTRCKILKTPQCPKQVHLGSKLHQYVGSHLCSWSTYHRILKQMSHEKNGSNLMRNIEKRCEFLNWGYPIYMA